MSDLAVPQDAAALYLARGSEVEALRPLMQGDVLDGVDIPGLGDEPGLAMVLTHPCTMRTSGGALKDHLSMARVQPHSSIGLASWFAGYFGMMPLPSLRPEEDTLAFAVDFEAAGPAATHEMNLGGRIACLSEYGIVVLEQRFVHHLTRAEIELPVFHKQVAPNLEEASLMEEWLVELVDDPASQTEVTNQTQDFDNFLSQPSDAPLRSALRDPMLRADVRRQVRQEIQRRLETNQI